MCEENIWSNVTNTLGKNMACSIWLQRSDELIIRSRDGLHFYKYSANDWKQTHFDPRFSDKNNFNNSRHKLNMFNLNNKNYLSFLSVDNGYVFLEIEQSTFRLKHIANDRKINRTNCICELGHFYGKESPLGLVTLNSKFDIAFHFINLATPKSPIHKKTNFDFKEQILNSTETNLFFQDINANGKTNIIAQNDTGLSVYELQACKDYLRANKLFDVPIVIKRDVERFYFVRLTPPTRNNNDYFDLLTIKSDGMRVFKWNHDTNHYDLINYSHEFAENNSWSTKHTNSILFADYNSSGCEKLFYTGPYGLRIDELEFVDSDWRWKSLVDFQCNPNLGQKYVIPLHVIPSVKSPNSKPMLLGNDLINKKTIFIEIKDYEETEIEEPREEAFVQTHKHPRKLIKIENEEQNFKKSILFLKNSIDIKSIVNSCINPANGQFSFDLPIIKLPVLNENLVSLNYASSSHSNDTILGQGWSFGQDFVYAEFKSRKNLHTFLLVNASGLTQLLEDKTENDEVLFKVENDKDQNFKIKFKKSKNEWTIENVREQMTKYYGGDVSELRPRGNGIEWREHWFRSEQFSNGSTHSFKWHLTKTKNHESSVCFDYTDDLLLRTISTSNQIKITLEYTKKTQKELEDCVLDKVVHSLKFESKHQTQSLRFNYEMLDNDSTRVLKSITQQDDDTIVLEFFYVKIFNLAKMSKIVFPDGADSLSLTYEDASEKVVNSHFSYLIESELATHEDKDTKSQLAVSNDYSILSYTTKSKAKLVLSILTREKIKFTAAVEQNELISYHKVHAFQDHFVVHLLSQKENQQAVYVCHLEMIRKQKETTSVEVKLTLLADTVQSVSFGSEFVSLVNEMNDFLIFEWHANEWTVVYEEHLVSNKVTMLMNEDETLLIYDDVNIKVLFKEDSKNEWKNKIVVSKPGFFSAIGIFVNSFSLKQEMSDGIIRFLEKNLVHFAKNIVLINHVYIRNDTIHFDQLTLFTDDELNVVKEELIQNDKIEINQFTTEHKLKLSETEEIDSKIYHYKDGDKYFVGFKAQEKTFEFKVRKNTFTRTYRLDKQIIEIKVIDHHGYDVEIEESTKSLKEDFNEAFLLDIDSFIVSLNPSRVICNKKYYELSSEQWTMKTIEHNPNDYVKINKKLEMIKNSTWRLYLDKHQVFDFETSDLSRIQIAYPDYIAFMKDAENVINILPLNKDSIGKQVFLTKADYVLPIGNPLLLCSKEPESCRVKFLTRPYRPMASVRVTERRLTLDKQDFVRKYEYCDNTCSIRNGLAIYSKFKVIPAGKACEYGFIEYDLDSEIKYFDSEGKVVKIESEKKNDREQKISQSSESNKQTILYAKDGHTEIANFFNLDVNSDEADYVGFEAYEQRKNWEYDEAHIVRNEWSLTGNSFLRLNKRYSHKITRSFKPKNLYYECGCWIRLNKELKLKQDFEDFRLILIETGQVFKSSVASSYQDWFYLKADIDLSRQTSQVSIKCEIELNSYEFIDIDHIKWTTLNNRVQLSSYDQSSLILVSLVNETNLIKRLVYDCAYQPLVLFDSNNQLQQMSFSHGKSIVQIEASNCFYETFCDYTLGRDWFIDSADDWSRNSNWLIHNHSRSNTISLTRNDINEKSLCLVFQIQVSLSASLSIELNSHKIVFNTNKIYVNKTQTIEATSSGYYLIIVEGGRLIAWKDNCLITDRRFDVLNSRGVSFKAIGCVKLSNLLVINEPVIKVSHLNSMGQVKQNTQLEDESNVIIKQVIYDELLRESTETKPTRVPLGDQQKSMEYFQGFVTNLEFDTAQNFWSTGQLRGKVSELNPLDKRYCYQRNIFSKNPLNYIESIDFGDKLISARNSVPCDTQTLEYFESLFPLKQGFVCNTSIELNGNRTVKVFDKNDNMVALFQYTIDFQHILTTYEYDDKNNLIKILPPSFHGKVLTLEQAGPTYEQLQLKWNSNDEHIKLQSTLGSLFVYDDNGSLIESKTPECGKKIFVYNKFGLVRFNLKFDQSDKPCILEYSNYNQWSEVCQKGYTENEKCFNIEWLKSMADSYQNELFDACCMQEAASSFSIKPNYNSKRVQIVVRNASNRFETHEKLYYSNNDKLIKKKTIFLRPDGSSCKLRMDRKYSGNQLTSIIYPFSYNDEIMKVDYKYNKQGLVSSISIRNKQIASFEYTASGSISRETFNETFERNYSYTPSGLMSSQDDCFVRESLSYNQHGYECGDKMSYDTSILRTKFTPKWYDRCDIRSLSLSEDTLMKKIENLNQDEASYLLKQLVELGVLDDDYKVQRHFSISEGLINLPLKYDLLTLNKLIELLNQHFPKTSYGHQYSYGAYSELVNSKYFIGEKIYEPVNAQSFALNNKITLEKSRIAYDALVRCGYISPHDEHRKFGKVNTNKWIDFESLRKLLAKWKCQGLEKKMAEMLQEYFANRKILTKDEFTCIFRKWNQTSENYSQFEANLHIQLASKLWDLMSVNAYFYESSDKQCALFKREFCALIKENDLGFCLPEIIRVLIEKSNTQVGSSPCDIRSYKTDANGNHSLFYIGLNRLKFDYTQNSNQIELIRSGGKEFRFEYDSFGNVVLAEHNGIEKIIYDQVSNRAVKFVLKNGAKVELAYDSMNERAYKCVKDKNSKKCKEILYFRDNKGRCLVEKEIFYDDNEQIRDEFFTAYLYGPKGLMGFVRQDEFFHVVTDHEQSVRLILKNMEVVAAYDYMPYGNLMRSFGSSSAQIRYRFTGQEWDEELGLYNYHARFYDPTIGRFYQVDAKEQYASPYKYAGNSPICMYDPDGNLAFLLLPIGLAVVGAYLGGSAASDSWNPTKWEWDNVNLYIGMFFGGLGGFFLPFGFAVGAGIVGAFFGVSFGLGCAVVIGLGVVFAYFGMSASSGTFNPLKWKWKKPGLWNSAFQGFSCGVQLPNAISNFAKFYADYGWKILVPSLMTAGGMAYLNVSSANNSFNPKNWKNTERTWIGAVNGALNGFFMPSSIVAMYKFNTGEFVKFSKNIIANKGILGYCIVGGIAGVMVAVPILFIIALKQEMCCDLWSLLKSPAGVETLISGVLSGFSMPNLMIKALPETLKIYRQGLMKFIYSNFYKNDQKLIQEFAEDLNKQRSEEIRKTIRESDAYNNASDEVKTKIDDRLKVMENELKTNGELSSINSFDDLFQDINNILNEGNNNINNQLSSGDVKEAIQKNLNLSPDDKTAFTELIDKIQKAYVACQQKKMTPTLFKELRDYVNSSQASTQVKDLFNTFIDSWEGQTGNGGRVTTKHVTELYTEFSDKLDLECKTSEYDKLCNGIDANSGLSKDQKISYKKLFSDLRTSLTKCLTYKSAFGSDGVYCVSRLEKQMEDGTIIKRTIICHSSSREFYMMFDENGNKIPISVPPNQNLAQNVAPDQALLAQRVNLETGHSNDAKNCAEFRNVHIIAHLEGFTPENIISINAFRAESSNLEPIIRCKNCKISTKMINESFVPTDRAQNPTMKHFNEIVTCKTLLNKCFIQEIRYDLNALFLTLNLTRYQKKKKNKFDKKHD